LSQVQPPTLERGIDRDRPARGPGRIIIRRLADNIGAEIGGGHTSVPLSDEVAAIVRQALLDDKVIFLCDQVLDY
jgi:alpha-ketoglutarate-dependent taurine dioxygenase